MPEHKPLTDEEKRLLDEGGLPNRPPTTEELVAAMLAEAPDLSEDQLKSAAIDVLNFVWCVARANGTFYVRIPGRDHEPVPYHCRIPGLIDDAYIEKWDVDNALSPQPTPPV